MLFWFGGHGYVFVRSLVFRAASEFFLRTPFGLHALLFQSLQDRKSTRLNSSHGYISYAVFCLKKKKICTPTLELLSCYDDYHHGQVSRADFLTRYPLLFE